MLSSVVAARLPCRALAVAVVTLVASTSPTLAATAAAQAPLTINSVWAGAYNLTSPPGLFAGHIAFSVDLTSVNPVASVTATFAGRTVSLHQGSLPYWQGDDMATADLPFGPTLIEIRATDTLGNSVATQLSLTHDNPPSIRDPVARTGRPGAADRPGPRALHRRRRPVSDDARGRAGRQRHERD